MTFTPAERRLRSQKAAHTRWAHTENRSAATLSARLGLEAKFEREADPDNTLTPAERAKRGESLRRAHYAGMALKSAQVRRRRSEGAVK